jgi:Ras-related protein Rab-4B
LFVETSAKTGEGVEEVFLHCAKTILNKIESGTLLALLCSDSIHSLLGVIKPEDLGCGIQVGTSARKRHVAPSKINNNSISPESTSTGTGEDCAC